jgi:hypothetical protein
MKQCNASVLPRSNAAIVLGRDEKMHAVDPNYCIQIYVDPLMSQQHLKLVNLHSLLPGPFTVSAMVSDPHTKLEGANPS